MYVETRGGRLALARVTNTTDVAFPSFIPVAGRSGVTESSGNGVGQAAARARVRCAADPNGTMPNSVMVIPCGAGNAGQTLAMRLIGWNFLFDGNDPEAGVWVPTLLFGVNCTLSAMTMNYAGQTLRLADTITVRTNGGASEGNDGVSIDVVNNGVNIPAHVIADVKGCEVIEFAFQNVTSSGANALFRLMY
jgi:hypothetical protein